MSENTCKYMNVSVIIPVYPPHYQYLSRCIKNIMTSTVLPNEIIVCASEITNENEQKLLNDLIHLCNSVTLIISGTKDQAYSGVNRNRGAHAASNDILMFIDADDYTHPQKIEIVSKCFKRYPNIKLLLHNCSLQEDSLNIIHDVDNIPVFKYIGDFNKKSIVNNGMKTIHRGHATVHKSIFENISYKDVRHREDNIFTKKVHLIFNESFFLPLSLMVYKESGIQFRDDYYDKI